MRARRASQCKSCELADLARGLAARGRAGTGFVDPETLRTIFGSLGYGTISDDDLRVLVETADTDRDGQISLEDFRAMLEASQKGAAEAAAAGL